MFIIFYFTITFTNLIHFIKFTPKRDTCCHEFIFNLQNFGSKCQHFYHPTTWDLWLCIDFFISKLIFGYNIDFPPHIMEETASNMPKLRSTTWDLFPWDGHIIYLIEMKNFLWKIYCFIVILPIQLFFKS